MKKFIIIVAIVGTAVFVGYFIVKKEIDHNNDMLDVINPTDIIDKSLVDSSLINQGFGHHIADFNFTNQYGTSISQKEVEGKVYVVDYFFTTCGSICPIMTNQLTRVQDAFLKDSNVLILSHTVWPENDSVPQLLNYARRFGAVKGKWHFLTGNKDSLYALARKSYFVLKPAEAKNAGDGNSDFIHTNNFVLIDQERKIRGYYDGTDSAAVGKLIHDIHFLLENSH
jgi:protein SCO1/2